MNKWRIGVLVMLAGMAVAMPARIWNKVSMNVTQFLRRFLRLARV